MSATSFTSPVSPLEHRDIRSSSRGFKRDKDHSEKWSMGMRPSSGMSHNFMTDEPVGGSEAQREKVRPMKQWSQMSTHEKSHANKTPKPTTHATYQFGSSSSRLDRKVDAIIDANDHTSSPLSRSLLELLPQHANNTQGSIQTKIREYSGDGGVLYSYEKNKPSPGKNGRPVDLGGLVEMAEKKWLEQQTDKIVKGEYEVLDAEGESMVLNHGKGKGKKSPKQRATVVKTEPSVVKSEIDEDDGFELV